MDRIYLSQFDVHKRDGEHVVELGCWRGKNLRYDMVTFRTDLNLGNIMAGFSSCLQTMLTEKPAEVQSYGGPIELERWTVEPLTIAPYAWHMLMATDRFSYAVNMDRDLEHVILAFSGALKFFCFKHGLSTLDDEVVRQRDRAGELGLLTKEDFHA